MASGSPNREANLVPKTTLRLYITIVIPTAFMLIDGDLLKHIKASTPPFVHLPLQWPLGREMVPEPLPP